MNSVAVVSMDIHKKFSKAVIMNSDCDIIGERRIEHDRHANMWTFFSNFEKDTDVVMEATFNWPWIADIAEEAGLSPHLAHPLGAREMAKRMPKSDRKDAIFLGKLYLSSNIFPEAYFAPREVRRMRSMFRTRSLLVRMRTATKNNIHGQLFRMGIDLDDEVSDTFSLKGRKVLENLSLPSFEREMLEKKLAFLDDLIRHISLLETEIKKDLKRDPRADILMSIPGIGEITAYAFLSEIGDISRFPNGRALAAYAGVLPLDNESADKDFGKKTGGNCNYFLRWSAIEAVSGAVRKSARMKSLHSRVKARNKHKPGKARVAVARRIMELVHLLLVKGETYKENPTPRPGSETRKKAEQRIKRELEGRERKNKLTESVETVKVDRLRGTADHPNRASQVPLCVRPENDSRGQTGV